MRTSAGLLMYRKTNGVPEILLAHPGGPLWAKKDEGAWDIPKGQSHDGEDLLDAAKREFEEETGLKPEGEFVHLASVKRKNGQMVESWVFEGDCDTEKLTSNTCLIEWPMKSGKQIEIPENDKYGFFSIEEAKKKVYLYHLETLAAFEKYLNQHSL